MPRAVEELDAVFTQISLDLSQQYLLSYYPQDERKDKYFRFISLRVKTRPTARVRARKGFYPDAAQAQTPDGRAQSASTRVNNAQSDLSTVPQTRAADTQTSLKREAAEAEAQKPAAARPARGKLGPDGPDTEEDARQRADVVAESVPTFTVVVSAAAPAAKSSAAPPAPEPKTSATPERVAGNSLFEAVANTSTTQPKPAPTPAPTPAPAAAPKPENGEVPKTPLSGGVLNGKALRLPVPNYPSAARNSGAQGKVVVEVLIDEQGKVIEAHAVSGHSFLLQAAVQAARQARFTPALLSGQPIKVKGTINYLFTLP